MSSLPPPSRRASLAAVTAPLLLLPLILLIYRRLVFSNLIIARGDTFLYFYPYWSKAAEALRAGRLPLWNPDLFMGAPFIANSQVGFFYPLNWPLWLLLPTPYAVSATIVLHLFIAAVGVYLLTRRALRLSPEAALLAGTLFALGGYLSAQVEHVNQAQGLAWLPWLLAVASCWRPSLHAATRRMALLALFFALQLLAGHTQTTFISGIALLLWVTPQLLAATFRRRQRLGKLWIVVIITLGGGVLLSILIAAIQLAPTLELTSLSRRQEGLPLDEVLSFSLHPLLFPRTLLPGYGQSPYAEYIAYLPIAAIVLIFVGAAQLRRRPAVFLPLLLVVVGLFLSFGEFNPLFARYIVHIPGFALFRVPARWLVLYALGGSLLAAAGWDALRLLQSRRQIWLPAALGLSAAAALIYLVPIFAELGMTSVPMPPENPAEMPTPELTRWWLIELGAVLALLLLLGPRTRSLRYLLWLPLLLSLLFAQRTVQQDALTTPEAYFELRQAPARLTVATRRARAQKQPPPRFLSISKGFFDPGDMGEIDSLYADQLGEEARYRYLVTTKEREILVPNLPLSFDLSAVDGFDGGLLPLYAYTRVAGLMLPPGVTTVDGRLREFIEFFPDARWLDLFGVRFLITDRTGDNWFAHEETNVFFDLQQRITLQPGETMQIGDLPPYLSTELWIIAEGSPGDVLLTTAEGEVVRVPSQKVTEPIYQAVWDQPLQPAQITLQAGDEPWLVAGVSLVDRSTQSFRMVVPGNYRLLHAGDVKVYENLDVLPRSFIVPSWAYVADVDEAVARLSDADPRQFATIEGSGQNQGSGATGEVSVVDYRPEHIELTATLDGEGLLLLTEAFYPGWQVTIDGQPAELLKVDGMFRGVFVEGGAHQVVFSYQPQSITYGVSLTIAGIAVALALFVAGRRPKPASVAPRTAAVPSPPPD